MVTELQSGIMREFGGCCYADRMSHCQESCRQNIELANSGGLQWLPDSSTIRIIWRHGPSEMEEEGEPSK